MNILLSSNLPAPNIPPQGKLPGILPSQKQPILFPPPKTLPPQQEPSRLYH
ncbi:hypothetical protein [Nitrosomonas sp. Nm166]|uniref:hypothetical protein n=1 Tax=Nitrosomonas sp. Nm166 TaxID=1881054 RepID=UPI0015A669E2|nr:hypothetical protein [Nitrosomonas sp. Nm166]